MICKSDWKIKALPQNKKQLNYRHSFLDEDAKKILRGFKPRDMDDKWFIYSEDGWVYFIRSWTGAYIFAIKLCSSPAGGTIVSQSWVNDNPDEFKSPGQRENISLINNLLKSLFQIETKTEQIK